MTSTTFFLVFIPILAVILLAVNLILAPHSPYEEKGSAFECGFHSFQQTRSPFNISFFIFALLFLLFDLEILLVYPYVVSAYTNGAYGLIVMLIFFVMLTLGFVYELGKGALKIDSRQTNNISDNVVKNNLIIHIKTLRGKAQTRALYQRRYYTTGPSNNVPITVYSNAFVDKDRKLRENKGKSGIYRWINLNNGRSYVGSSVHLKERFISYYNKNHLRDNYSMLICRALIKHGYSSFRLEILEYCTLEDLVAKENYYISYFNPEYNLVQESSTMPSRLGYTHSKTTIVKIAKAQPSRVTVSVKDLMTNTEKIYHSIREAEKDLNLAYGRIVKYFNRNQVKPLNKRYIVTKLETTYVKTTKVVESWRTGIRIEVLDLDTGLTTIYPTIRSAAKELDIARSTISNYLQLGEPYMNKYKFSYYKPSTPEED